MSNAPDATIDPNSHTLPDPVDGGTVLGFRGAPTLDQVNPPYPATWPSSYAEGLLVERQGYKDRGLDDRVAEVDAELAKVGVSVDADGHVQIDGDYAPQGSAALADKQAEVDELTEELARVTEERDQAAARADEADTARADQIAYLEAVDQQAGPGADVEAPGGGSAPGTETATPPAPAPAKRPAKKAPATKKAASPKG